MTLSFIAELTPAFHAACPSGILSLVLCCVCQNEISQYSHLQSRRLRLPFLKGGKPGLWACETFEDSHIVE